MESAVSRRGRGVIRCEINSGNVTPPITARPSKSYSGAPGSQLSTHPLPPPSSTHHALCPNPLLQGDGCRAQFGVLRVRAQCWLYSHHVFRADSPLGTTFRSVDRSTCSSCSQVSDPHFKSFFGGVLICSFIAGTVSGTTKCLVGHPFDTIKTRMQTNPSFAGPWECLSKTLRLEGIRGLYKVPPQNASPRLTSPR
jgi:Mitochondrial carrier protein